MAPLAACNRQKAEQRKGPKGHAREREEPRRERVARLLHAPQKIRQQKAAQPTQRPYHAGRDPDLAAEPLRHQMEHRSVAHAQARHSHRQQPFHCRQSWERRADGINRPDADQQDRAQAHAPKSVRQVPTHRMQSAANEGRQGAE